MLFIIILFYIVYKEACENFMFKNVLIHYNNYNEINNLKIQSNAFYY
jgi:hypothetical protein